MGEACEHDVAEGLGLVHDSIDDVRVLVAVAHAPPTGNAIDQFAAIGKFNQATAGARDWERLGHCLHLRVGQPDMWVALGEPLWFYAH